VVDAAQVFAVAARAAERFGAIDAWINDAGVYAVGCFEEIPEEIHERVMEVNYFGTVNGARAALPHLRKSRGVLVNISSTLGLVGSPFVTPYVASKHAVRGFSEALREEERKSGAWVSCVFPPAVDTPLFEHSANYSGKVIRPAGPIMRPEQIARAIVGQAIVRRKREVLIGPNKLFNLMHLVARPLFERVIARRMERDHFLPQPERPHEGNLFEPMAKGTQAQAGWKAPPLRTLLRAFPSALRETLRGA
jgi:short-subunit dehydrogenase